MIRTSGKANRSRSGKRKAAGRQRVRYSPAPEFLTCPHCGLEMDLWSGDEETRCLICGHRFFPREATIH